MLFTNQGRWKHGIAHLTQILFIAMTTWQRPSMGLGEKDQRGSGGHTVRSVMEDSYVLDLQAGEPQRTARSHMSPWETLWINSVLHSFQ